MSLEIYVFDNERCKTDIVYFVEKFCWIISPFGLVKAKLTKKQKQLLKKDRVAMMCGKRQSGISTASYFKIIHSLIFGTRQHIAYLCPKHAWAQQSIREIEYLYNLCEYPYKPKISQARRGSLTLENHNRVTSHSLKSPNSLRGLTFNSVFISEFDFVDTSEFFEILTCIIPSVSIFQDSVRWAWSIPQNYLNLTKFAHLKLFR
jgi:hypothetical protein